MISIWKRKIFWDIAIILTAVGLWAMIFLHWTSRIGSLEAEIYFLNQRVNYLENGFNTNKRLIKQTHKTICWEDTYNYERGKK